MSCNLAAPQPLYESREKVPLNIEDMRQIHTVSQRMTTLPNSIINDDQFTAHLTFVARNSSKKQRPHSHQNFRITKGSPFEAKKNCELQKNAAPQAVSSTSGKHGFRELEDNNLLYENNNIKTIVSGFNAASVLHRSRV